jgi:hypothetical protein
MTPPFFQATIAKSSQSNLHRHKTALRKTAAHRESVSTEPRNKKCVHRIAVTGEHEGNR